MTYMDHVYLYKNYLGSECQSLYELLNDLIYSLLGSYEEKIRGKANGDQSSGNPVKSQGQKTKTVHSSPG